VAFVNAKLQRGVDVVLEAVKFSETVKDADLVITGEGSLDGQTIHGKTPCGIARAAKAYGIPVLAVAGQLGRGWELVYEQGIDGVASIMEGPMTLAEAVKDASQLVTKGAERICRVFLTGYLSGKRGKTF
jgi:glycerate kinase